MRTAALILLLALLVAPPVQASTSAELLDVKVDPGRITIERRDTYTGDDAVNIRRAVDIEGDKDGVVSQAEATEYQSRQTRGMPVSAECWRHFNLASFDGKVPTGLHAAADMIEGLPGSIDARPISWTRQRAFQYADGPMRVTTQFDDPTFAQLQPRCPADSSVTYTVAVNEFPVGPYTIAVIHIPRDARFVPSAARPTWISLPQDSPDFLLDRASLERLGDEPFVFEARSTPDNPSFAGGSSEVPLSAVAWVAGSALLVALLRTPAASWILVGLFTRLHRHELLENPHRETLHRLIEVDPGSSLADLRRATGMAHGTALYHLRILHRHGLIRMQPDGWRTRFFPLGAVTANPYLSGHQLRILSMITSNPGVSQSELAARLGMPRKTVAHHLARLQQVGRVHVRTEGRRRAYTTATVNATSTAESPAIAT